MNEYPICTHDIMYELAHTLYAVSFDDDGEFISNHGDTDGGICISLVISVLEHYLHLGIIEIDDIPIFFNQSLELPDDDPFGITIMETMYEIATNTDDENITVH